MARMGYKGSATAHGFRALFSTVANEAGWNPDVIERQLAHMERNKIRAAYHCSTYMDERARLMQWWADHLDGRKAGNVVPFGSLNTRLRQPQSNPLAAPLHASRAAFLCPRRKAFTPET
ncbi:tyrosine-type recombinase/integrase [Acidovorax sp. SDU_ACID1]|uniref:tyrosine-type recombinase/integrase n=1 Tax=Acidovorax sp. SDU_ACID1 TaxID=3136632 RepID=UPI003872BC39